jgi:hypothetical protein
MYGGEAKLAENKIDKQHTGNYDKKCAGNRVILVRNIS